MVLGAVMAATSVTAVNMAGYVDTKQKLEIESDRDLHRFKICDYQNVLTGYVLAKKYSQQLQQRFDFLRIGERTALQEYADFCEQFDDVGVI